MIRRRFFQFSLRGFLIVVTVGCLWLGWNVERARRRGRAIDAIVVAGGFVDYAGSDGLPLDKLLGHGEYVNHFWRDLRRVPVEISLVRITIDGSIGQLVAGSAPIESLAIRYPKNDDALRHFAKLNDGCKLSLLQLENATSTAELERLQQRLPKVDIKWIRRGRLTGTFP